MSREKAQSLLRHYFGVAGVRVEGDSRLEIDEIVDEIIDTAKGELRERLDKIESSLKICVKEL